MCLLLDGQCQSVVVVWYLIVGRTDIGSRRGDVTATTASELTVAASPDPLGSRLVMAARVLLQQVEGSYG